MMKRYSIIWGGVLLLLAVGCGGLDKDKDASLKVDDKVVKEEQGSKNESGNKGVNVPQKNSDVVKDEKDSTLSKEQDAQGKPGKGGEPCDSSNRFCSDRLKFCPDNSSAIDLGKKEDGVESPIYGKCIKSVHFGKGAGYGQVFVEGEGSLYTRGFPDIVLGPPDPEATPKTPALDVLSLGKDGSIVIDFGYVVYDYSGPDLFVFENVFEVVGGGSYMELGKVSVSLDGIKWTPFPCNYQEIGTPPLQTCAGVKPTETLSSDPEITPLSVSVRGGDAFDLADINVEKFRYVKIEDMSARSSNPSDTDVSYGFDLDAIGANIRQ